MRREIINRSKESWRRCEKRITKMRKFCTGVQLTPYIHSHLVIERNVHTYATHAAQG
jgi:hypothetical protein